MHLLPHLGQKDIADITREEVKQLVYGLLSHEKSRGTVKGILTPLSAMFNLAVEDQHVTANPVIRTLKRSRKEEGSKKRKRRS